MRSGLICLFALLAGASFTQDEQDRTHGQKHAQRNRAHGQKDIQQNRAHGQKHVQQHGPHGQKDALHAGRIFKARCATCHTVPDPAVRTDRAWLDQVNRTA